MLIAAAGGAAALPGVVAAFSPLPVIGVPIASTPLNGMDALLSIVQMPKGVPVATVAIGSWGAANAAILAAQILAQSDAALAERLAAYRRALSDEVEERGPARRREAADALRRWLARHDPRRRRWTPGRPRPPRSPTPSRRSARAGVVAFPTETFYGLGVAALTPAAVRRIFAGEGASGRQAAARARRLHRHGRAPRRARSRSGRAR